MTKNNEQIIIDGVDVSECEFYNKVIDEDAYCNIDEEHLCTCISYDNCYYKQLKCKEQECEELKEEFKLFQQLKDKDSFRVVKLSTENVKLKHQLDLYKKSHKTEQDRRRAFEQTLEEIREIAEKGFKNSICNCAAKADLYYILQKINEVIDD